MKISVSVKGIDQVKAMLAGQAKQIPYATSRAINAVAKAIEDEQRKTIGAKFDRPKAQTVRATFVLRSNKNNLTATVGLKDRGRGVPAAEYLAPNIGKNGRIPRNPKRSEYMLRTAGILPSGLFTVPGKEARLDAFGNMSRGQIVQILGYFRTFGNSPLNTKRMNVTDKYRAKAAKQQRQYFVVPVSDRKLKLYPGIWQEKPDRTLAPILMFVSRPVYNAVYDFYGSGRQVVNSRFDEEFNKYWRQSVSTAR
jgi:hypothetical protein